jgi:hypothetical protein
VKNTTVFKPYCNQPKLPHNLDKPNPNYFEFVQVAWHVYWTWAEREAKKHHCSVWEARQYVHAKGKLPRQRDRNKHMWTTDDYLAEFMMQFEGWQMRRYDLQRLHEVDLAREYNCNIIDQLMGDRSVSFFVLIELLSIRDGSVAVGRAQERGADGGENRPAPREREASVDAPLRGERAVGRAHGAGGGSRLRAGPA